jgi:phage virion morphogenesis protein
VTTTGVRLEATIDDAAVRAALADLARRGADLSEPMDDIAAYLEASTTDRFLSGQVGPDGRPWPPSDRARREGGKTLVDKGAQGGLLGSLTSTSSALEAVVGVAKPYAAIHQLGGRAGRGGQTEILARPYLGLSAEDEREVTSILEDWLGQVPGVSA